MKEKAKKVFHFLKKRVRLSVIIVTLLFGVLLLIGSYSYAFYTISTEKENVLSLAAVRFDYVLNEQYENEMTLSFTEQEISEFPISIQANNLLTSSWQLYYLDPNSIDITVYYQEEGSLPYGNIDPNGNVTVTLVIQNRSGKSGNLTIGVQGGLVDKELTLSENHIRVDTPYSSKIPILVDSVTGGTTTTVSSANPGDVITLTNTPNSGFSYYGATVTNTETKEVLTTLSSSQKTFTMPDYGVTVRPKWLYESKKILWYNEVSAGTWIDGRTDGCGSSFRLFDNGTTLRFDTSCRTRKDAWRNLNIDLTHYSSLVVQILASGPTTFSAVVSTSTSSWVHYTSGNKSVTTNGGWVSVNLDLTNITGNRYLGVQALYDSGSVTIDAIRLGGRLYQ